MGHKPTPHLPAVHTVFSTAVALAVVTGLEDRVLRNNMSNNDKDYLRRAAEFWKEGQPLEAGKLIFENLPSQTRPKWAAKILRLVLGRSGVDQTPFWMVLHTADHQAMWGNGHRAFSMLRGEVLKLDGLRSRGKLASEQVLLAEVLSLAELVAKVTYNATDPPDEFDEDSGWWIAACLRGFVENVWRDEEFSKAAWSALCSEEG
jgi:hypothetical protein